MSPVGPIPIEDIGSDPGSGLLKPACYHVLKDVAMCPTGLSRRLRDHFVNRLRPGKPNRTAMGQIREKVGCRPLARFPIESIGTGPGSGDRGEHANPGLTPGAKFCRPYGANTIKQPPCRKRGHLATTAWRMGYYFWH